MFKKITKILITVYSIFNFVGCETNYDVEAIKAVLNSYIFSTFGHSHVPEILSLDFDTQNSAIVIVNILRWNNKADDWEDVSKHLKVYFKRNDTSWIVSDVPNRSNSFLDYNEKSLEGPG